MPLFLINILYLKTQLKKTTEELNEALATKEEIAQRCHELDMQVGTEFCYNLQCCMNRGRYSVGFQLLFLWTYSHCIISHSEVERIICALTYANTWVRKQRKLLQITTPNREKLNNPVHLITVFPHCVFCFAHYHPIKTPQILPMKVERTGLVHKWTVCKVDWNNEYIILNKQADFKNLVELLLVVELCLYNVLHKPPYFLPDFCFIANPSLFYSSIPIN